MISYIFLILNFLFLILVFYLTLAFITGAPYVPTRNDTAVKMLEFSDIKPGMKVYDLGSGDGKLLFMAAKNGAVATGFEINPYLVILTNIRALVTTNKNVKAVWKNFWHADLKDADVVYVYLLPWRMKQLDTMLKKNLKKRSLVISNSFIFPDWKIEKQDPDAHVYTFRV